MATIRARAREKDGIVELKLLIDHPMESGLRQDDSGEPIPAHYIKELTIKQADKVLMAGNWGPAVSRNPYLALKLNNVAKGDTLSIRWTDTAGDWDCIEVLVN